MIFENGGAKLEDKLEYASCEVIKNVNVRDNVYKLELAGSFRGVPGQFYMLRSWDSEPMLSRPVSINYLDGEKIVFLYQVVGKGTEMLCNLNKGDKLKVMGPLGNGFDMSSACGKVAVVSGGIGIAPFLYFAEKLKEKHDKSLVLDVYAGFREHTYMIDEIGQFADNVYCSVEQGNEGKRGYVTDIFVPENYDCVLCCGPEKMMMKVLDMCRKKSVPVYVSMEKRMACGIGACLVCTCKTKSGNKRTCCDGPVFSGKDLN